MQQDKKTLKNTIMILGAGASKEFGLPTWVGLKEELSKLAADKKTHPSLIQSFQDKETYFKILTEIIKDDINGSTIDERFSKFMRRHCVESNEFKYNNQIIDGELFEEFFWGSIEYIFYTIFQKQSDQELISPRHLFKLTFRRYELPK